MPRKIGFHRNWPICTTAILYAFFTLIPVIPLAAKTPGPSASAEAQESSELESTVIRIFRENCTLAGCHSGSTPMMGLKLTEDEFYARTVNQPSLEMPAMMRVKPGEPDNSYLVKKIIGAEGIIGSRMPFGRDPLTSEEVAAVVDWIKNMKQVDTDRLRAKTEDPLTPFNAWKVINLPTSRMVDKGNWLFLISHRFLPPLDAGYDAFYGLDGSGIIFLNMGYAVSDRLFINLGRSNAEDDVEFNIKYGLKQQFPSDKLPIAAAAQLSVNWITEKKGDQKRLRSEAFKVSGQLIFSSQPYPGIGINVVPGILFNPDSEIDSEDPLLTLGLGGRAHLWKSISLIGEWAPIFSGFTLTSTSGEFNRFDSWGAGVELSVGGHAFHILVSNSVGLTTDQYMRGGSLDIRDWDMRLGFNIFRPLQF